MRYSHTFARLIVAAFLAVVLATVPASLWHGGVAVFGSLSLGGESPLGPGAATFAPELHIPPSRFYIGIAQKGIWCVFEECGLIGSTVAALGGWLQSEDAMQPTVAEDFGLSENQRVASVIIVGDKKGKIVGIYPNKGVDDLSFVLRVHRDLLKF